MALQLVTIYEVGKLFAKAFSRAAVVETAVNGFRKTGVSPYNPDVFPDHLFEPSLTTDHPMPQVPPQPIDPTTGASSAVDLNVGICKQRDASCVQYA